MPADFLANVALTSDRADQWIFVLALLAVTVFGLLCVFALAASSIEFGARGWRWWTKRTPPAVSDETRRQQLESIAGVPATWRPTAAKGFTKAHVVARGDRR